MAKINQAEERGFRPIQWIPVKNLSVIWAEAQRPLNKRHADTISDNFDPEMFGTLAVTLPNGHGIYHVIDGHHRKVAVENKYGPNETVPCQVYEAEDPARAAELFDMINGNRRALSALEMFRVRVTAKKELQVEVNKIVQKTGFMLGHHEENSIWCVGALETVYQSYGPAILESVLLHIKGMWGPDNSGPQATIVRGLGMFLSEFRHINTKKMMETIAAKYTPNRLVAAARAAREQFGGNANIVVRDIFLQAYNKNVRGDKNKLRIGEKKR